MRNIAYVLCLTAAASLSCSTNMKTPTGNSNTAQIIANANAAIRAANAAAQNAAEQQTSNSVTPDDEARILVGLDCGENSAANVEDIDVKRVRYLLGVLIYQSKESATDIGFGVDRASGMIEKQFGRRIKRQQLLEDMANAYSKKLIKVDGQKFKDVVDLWATMKYGK